MSLSRLEADQLYTWSAIYGAQTRQTVLFCFAETSPTAPAPAAAVESFAAWLAHRALQTLRQAGMQVCERSRAWPQVLSLGELPRPAAANGLRAAGLPRADQQVSGSLPPGARDLGGDLRDQPPTAPPPRGALNDERCTSLARCSARYAIRQRAPRQHARQLARERAQLFGHRGGKR
jgi:hypothetical protein